MQQQQGIQNINQSDKVDGEAKEEVGDNLALQEKELFHSIGITAVSKKGCLLSTNNQDDYFIYSDPFTRFYCIIHGHGNHGSSISNLILQLAVDIILKDKNFYLDPLNVVQQGLKKIPNLLQDKILEQNDNRDINTKFSGAAVTIVFQLDNKLYIGHIGDSRAIIGQKFKQNKKKLIQLTTDHVPGLKEEKIRIYSHGGEVKCLQNDRSDKIFVRGRLYPGLTVSRSIGDEVASLIGVNSDPEINVYELNQQNDVYLLIGTRSVFEYLDEYEINIMLQGFNVQNVSFAADQLYKRVKQSWIQNQNIYDDITFILSYFFHN